MALSKPSTEPRVRSLPRQIADSFFAVVFPASCALCHELLEEAGSLDVCAACWSELAPWGGPMCSHCGLPFASGRALDAAEPLCAACRQGEFQFDAARSFGIYRDRLRAAIVHLKFRRRERWGRRLGSLLAATWNQYSEIFEAEPVTIVPVPLHPGRKRERGYNQAEALVRGLVRALGKGRRGLQVDTECLKKIRATKPQTALRLAQRWENVRGAFAVAGPDSLTDHSVVLVDDVMTSGATLSTCAAALKAAGARRVMGLTLARATPQFPDMAVDEPRME